MLVSAAGVGLLEILLEETVIRQTGDASPHTNTEMNALATMSTAKTGAQPLQMVMHADGRGQLQIPPNGNRLTQLADVT